MLFTTILALCLSSCADKKGAVIAEWSTENFKISIGHNGAIKALVNPGTGKDYLAKDTSSYLMSIRVNNDIKNPQTAQIKDDEILLQFENNIEANIKVRQKPTHLTFEVVSIKNNDSVDVIFWGPYNTTINKTISETVGVVRGEEYAIGIQSLNIKTLGGYPWNESDRMPAFDMFRQEFTNDMHPDTDGSVLYRVEAAKPTKNGSSLQAYCRNRTKERIISDFNHEKIEVPPYNDGGVVGSKIALFGCAVEQTLQNIGEIEIAEGLPHPVIDGEWSKTSPLASSAYLITSFTEDNVDQAIALTKKAGLKYLYHYGKTFESWGHFDLYKGEFPTGIEGLKKCVEKAEAQGIKIGTHCLSNFITTNDPYVTPVPDKRLALVGSSLITDDINITDTEIKIQSPDFFNQMKNNSLKTVMIGDELIRYNKVSEQAPWILQDCQRGAFNTRASAHRSGEVISKLLDHSYNVFLTNADLTVEMSETLAELYNKTGLRQISFDGLEGNRSTGLGTYGESLMPYTWYNALSDDLKNHLIIDASRTTHFFWHIYTRMNWGEPWYAGFRESQTEYRFNNQAYFKRNFMPGMLGWFKLTPETSIEDLEWLLARSAGYDAGYALVAGMESVEKNGNADKIMDLIGDWEKLRISNAFTEAQKEVMRDNTKEFTLERIKDGQWNWREVYTERFTHEKKVRQPGEPLFSTFKFNTHENQSTLHFVLTPDKCDVSQITLELNNYKKIQLPVAIKAGQILKYSGGDKAYLYNSNWTVLKSFDISSADFKITGSENTLALDCNFDRTEKESNLKLEIRIPGKEQKVILNK